MENKGIIETAVFGRDDSILGEAICAAVVLADNANLSEADIVTFCKERLADFKAPRTVIFTTSLPKNQAGKIDRQKVRKLN